MVTEVNEYLIEFVLLKFTNVKSYESLSFFTRNPASLNTNSIKSKSEGLRVEIRYAT